MESSLLDAVEGGADIPGECGTFQHPALLQLGVWCHTESDRSVRGSGVSLDHVRVVGCYKTIKINIIRLNMWINTFRGFQPGQTVITFQAFWDPCSSAISMQTVPSESHWSYQMKEEIGHQNTWNLNTFLDCLEYPNYTH